MPATVLFLESKNYVIVGIYASISGFLLMYGDVRFSGTPRLGAFFFENNAPFDNTNPIYLTNLLWKFGLGIYVKLIRVASF